LQGKGSLILTISINFFFCEIKEKNCVLRENHFRSILNGATNKKQKQTSFLQKDEKLSYRNPFTSQACQTSTVLFVYVIARKFKKKSLEVEL